MKYDILIGIDPGLKGGIALYIPSINSTNKNNYEVFPMPTRKKEKKGNTIDIISILHSLINPYFTKAKVYIEKVHAMPKQGVSSMFTFGKGYGKLLGMCETLEWDIKEVVPRTWKKVILKDYDKHDKEAAINHIQKNHPNINLVPKRCRKPHDGMADALCVLEYGLKEENNAEQ